MDENLAMPQDRNSKPIPVLSLRRGAGAHQIEISATAESNVVPIVSKVVSIYATAACFVEIGVADVEATSTSHFIPANTWLDLDMSDGTGDGTHISVISPDETGTLYVSERM